MAAEFPDETASVSDAKLVVNNGSIATQIYEEASAWFFID